MSVKTHLRRMLQVLMRPFLNTIAASLSAIYQGNELYPIFAKHGFHLLRHHYYLPIPEAEDQKYLQQSDLPGVNINTEKMFNFIEDVLAPYKAEFNAFPVEKTNDPAQFHLLNGSYMAIDGNVYYSLIRHYRPNRVIEIGSGNSTRLAGAAIRRNLEENSDNQTELTCIEPYPPADLKQHVPEITRFIEEKVQEVDLEVFTSLKANDILFIDSTHVLRSGGDVWWEYCEILPRLASGVLVHIHDISLPKPYPDVYRENHLYWNEQYLLQAFLAYNSRFEVLWAGNYMMTHHPQQMKQAFSPEYDLMRQKFPSSEPSAFWMRVR